MDYYFATLIEYCGRCHRWGTHFEKQCDRKIRQLIDDKFNYILHIYAYIYTYI
jgi:hypothetical protein